MADEKSSICRSRFEDCGVVSLLFLPEFELLGSGSMYGVRPLKFFTVSAFAYLKMISLIVLLS